MELKLFAIRWCGDRQEDKLLQRKAKEKRGWTSARWVFGKQKLSLVLTLLLLSSLGHIGVVTCLSLSSDGNYLASGGEDKTIRLWDTRSQKLIETFRGHRNGVSVRSWLNLTIPGKAHPHL